MNDVSLKAVIGKFENLFSIFNKKYYDNQLETPVITVSPDVTRGAYGWCTYGSWKHETQKELKLISKQQRNFVCELFKESYQVLGIEIEEGDTNGN